MAETSMRQQLDRQMIKIARLEISLKKLNNKVKKLEGIISRFGEIHSGKNGIIEEVIIDWKTIEIPEKD